MHVPIERAMYLCVCVCACTHVYSRTYTISCPNAVVRVTYRIQRGVEGMRMGVAEGGGDGRYLEVHVPGPTLHAFLWYVCLVQSVCVVREKGMCVWFSLYGW